MLNIPMIPMVKILTQYAIANQLHFNRRDFKSIKKVFEHYNQTAKILN